MTEKRFGFAFVMDQQVGLKTASLNMQRDLEEDGSIEADFIPVQYRASLGIADLLPFPQTMKGTLRGIREIRNATVALQRSEGILWGTWAAKSVPYLVRTRPAFLRLDMTPRQMEAMGKEYGYSPWRAALLRGWKERSTNALYRQACHLFPWSRYVADSLQSDYAVPPEKITAISPGTDVRRFSPDPARSADPDIVRLLFVGGDFLRKGGDLLLDWLAKRETRTGDPKVELHLVTRDVVANPGAITGLVVHSGLVNNSPELIALYRRSDIFVLPTRADCYSLVSMEALACGLPVIVTAIGGIPDIVSEGETGFLFEREDVRTMAERLEMLIRDRERRRAMSFAARERACKYFDSRLCTAQLVEIMKAKTTDCGRSSRTSGQE